MLRAGRSPSPGRPRQPGPSGLFPSSRTSGLSQRAEGSPSGSRPGTAGALQGGTRSQPRPPRRSWRQPGGQVRARPSPARAAHARLAGPGRAEGGGGRRRARRRWLGRSVGRWGGRPLAAGCDDITAAGRARAGRRGAAESVSGRSARPGGREGRGGGTGRRGARRRGKMAAGQPSRPSAPRSPQTVPLRPAPGPRPSRAARPCPAQRGAGGGREGGRLLQATGKPAAGSGAAGCRLGPAASGSLAGCLAGAGAPRQPCLGLAGSGACPLGTSLSPGGPAPCRSREQRHCSA